MITVLGPGRCGTSTIARLLYGLGIPMGRRFREPDRSNPKGFFEDLDFRDLNHAVLRGQISNSAFQKKLDKEVEYNDYLKQWGVKDPRICQLWQNYRRYNSQYIVCTRRPQLIVKSLMVNYGWSELESKQLLVTRLSGIDRLLEGRDALRIDFSHPREDTELTHLLKHFLRLP